MIVWYQRVLSPRKGFRCAHSVYYHGDSCSDAVKKIIQRRGVIGGYDDIRAQFKRCTYAYQCIEKDQEKEKEKDKRRRRRCEPDCSCSAAEALNCIPKKFCKGPDMDGCDLPCDCS